MEKLLVRHVIRQPVAIAAIYFVPIESVFLLFVIMEAIFGVDDLPKSFEIPARSVVGYAFGNTGCWQEECQDDDKIIDLHIHRYGLTK